MLFLISLSLLSVRGVSNPIKKINIEKGSVLFGYENPNLTSNGLVSIHVNEASDVEHAIIALDFREMYYEDKGLSFNYFIKIKHADGKQEVIAFNTNLLVASFKGVIYSFDLNELQSLKRYKSTHTKVKCENLAHARYISKTVEGYSNLLLLENGAVSWQEHSGYLVFGATISKTCTDVSSYAYAIKKEVEERYPSSFIEPRGKTYEHQDSLYVIFWMYCDSETAYNFFDYPLLQEWERFDDIELHIVGGDKQFVRKLINP